VELLATNAPTMLSEPVDRTEQSAELTRLFRTHVDFVWRVLRRFGLSAAEADDGVQEVFLVVHSKLSTYEERAAMRAWLFTVARQVANHARRADARRQRRNQLSEPPLAYPDPHEAAASRELAALVERFLSQLDEGQAMVFYLTEIEGLSAPEIAAALALELSTVYGRQRLSRKQFESYVRRQHRSGARP
jgi:RNA polymerase sigma-70 factor, ECF subfamily